MQRTDKNPSSHIDSLPDESREAIRRLDQLIRGVLEGHSRVLWEGKFWGGTDQVIIGYGDFNTTQSRGKRVEWFMVGLALQKNHISVYVNAVQDGQYVCEKFGSKLGKVKIGKASIGFKRLEDINIPALTRILEIARDQINQAAK